MSDNRHGPNNFDVGDQNALRGGPRTPQGKQRSKYNALKTGIFATVVLTAAPFRENRVDFVNFLADLRAAIGPRDQLENIFVENLALQFFRLVRVHQADATIAPLLFRKVREQLEANGEDVIVAETLNDDSSGSARVPATDLFIRYEASVWRQIDRIMDRIQKWRKLSSKPNRRMQ
jgi:hypothetical protein